MIQALIPLFGTVLDKIFPDESKAAEAKFKMMALMQSGDIELTKQAGSVITAEANSAHWIVAAWRPLTMLTFTAIVANNYIIAPYILMFFDQDVALEMPPELWNLLTIGLGGYIVGRSGEKMVKAHAKGKDQ